MNHDAHVLANMAAIGPLDCKAAGCEGAKPKPYYERDGVSLYHGDMREVLAALPAESVSCCVLAEFGLVGASVVEGLDLLEEGLPVGDSLWLHDEAPDGDCLPRPVAPGECRAIRLPERLPAKSLVGAEGQDDLGLRSLDHKVGQEGLSYLRSLGIRYLPAVGRIGMAGVPPFPASCSWEDRVQKVYRFGADLLDTNALGEQGASGIAPNAHMIRVALDREVAVCVEQSGEVG